MLRDLLLVPLQINMSKLAMLQYLGDVFHPNVTLQSRLKLDLKPQKNLIVRKFIGNPNSSQR